MDGEGRVLEDLGNVGRDLPVERLRLWQKSGTAFCNLHIEGEGLVFEGLCYVGQILLVEVSRLRRSSEITLLQPMC